jgi:type VI secretion system secreted protein VgrG
MMTNVSQANRIATIETPLGHDLLFDGMNADEALGYPFRFELSLAGLRGDVRADDVLGKSALIRMQRSYGTGARLFHGFFTRFALVRSDRELFFYKATLSPWLWFLARSANCRIFQDQSVPEIVENVFESSGFGPFYFERRLRGSYTPWEYCVQYRETDYAFVTRLMEQEGIYYYFEHHENRHILILSDAPTSHRANPGYESVKWQSKSQGGYDIERMHYWSMEQTHQTGSYRHTDYDFTNPKQSLQAHYSLQGDYARSDYEVYDYPGEYNKLHDGEEWARVRMQSLQSVTRLATGYGGVRGLCAGALFELVNPADPAWSEKYLILSTNLNVQSNAYTSSTAGVQGFACSVTAIRASEYYRPQRTIEKPRIAGVQTAMVTGPKDQEVFTDKYGRVKVQFHWDRKGKKDANTTCFVRVGQFCAGRRWGALFTPRIGQEVIVAFLEGDPDQPIIIGSVYNAIQMPAYLGEGPDRKHADDPNISGIKTNTTPGGNGYNELRFDDSKGKEQVFLHSERDVDVRVKNDTRTDVGGSLHLTVGFQDNSGELHGFIKEKIFRSKSTHARKTIGVYADGQHFVFVGEQGKCKQFMNAAGAIVTTAEQLFSVKAPTIVLEGGGEICLTCGPSFIKLTPAGIYINGPMVYINSGGHSTSSTEIEYSEPLEPDAAGDSKSGFSSAPPVSNSKP